MGRTFTLIGEVVKSRLPCSFTALLYERDFLSCHACEIKKLYLNPF